jgi:hypothetical protein
MCARARGQKKTKTKQMVLRAALTHEAKLFIQLPLKQQVALVRPFAERGRLLPELY